jgi:hypothetical protein
MAACVIDPSAMLGGGLFGIRPPLLCGDFLGFGAVTFSGI